MCCGQLDCFAQMGLHIQYGRAIAAVFIVGDKARNLPAPTGSNDVDWVQLKNAECELADIVYGVNTKGRQPPSLVSRAITMGLHRHSNCCSALLAIHCLQLGIQPSIASAPKMSF